jgi:hypothetical protein
MAFSRKGMSLRAAVLWRRGSPLSGWEIASPGKKRRVRNDKHKERAWSSILEKAIVHTKGTKERSHKGHKISIDLVQAPSPIFGLG